MYVAVLEKEVELTLVPSESQQNNHVLHLTWLLVVVVVVGCLGVIVVGVIVLFFLL